MSAQRFKKISIRFLISEDCFNKIIAHINEATSGNISLDELLLDRTISLVTLAGEPIPDPYADNQHIPSDQVFINIDPSFFILTPLTKSGKRVFVSEIEVEQRASQAAGKLTAIVLEHERGK